MQRIGQVQACTLRHIQLSPGQQQQQLTSGVDWEEDLEGGCKHSARQRAVCARSASLVCMHALLNAQHAQPRPAAAAHLGGGLGGGFGGGLQAFSTSAASLCTQHGARVHARASRFTARSAQKTSSSSSPRGWIGRRIWRGAASIQHVSRQSVSAAHRPSASVRVATHSAQPRTAAAAAHLGGGLGGGFGGGLQAFSTSASSLCTQRVARVHARASQRPARSAQASSSSSPRGWIGRRIWRGAASIQHVSSQFVHAARRSCACTRISIHSTLSPGQQQQQLTSGVDWEEDLEGGCNHSARQQPVCARSTALVCMHARLDTFSSAQDSSSSSSPRGWIGRRIWRGAASIQHVSEQFVHAARRSCACTRFSTPSTLSPGQQQQLTSGVDWEEGLEGGCKHSARQQPVCARSTALVCMHAHLDSQHAQPRRPAAAAHLRGGLGGGFGGGLQAFSTSAASLCTQHVARVHARASRRTARSAQ